MNRVLRDERGFSMVFTLLAISVISVTAGTVFQYTYQNSNGATRSKRDQVAYALAEAGLAEGAATLSKPSNNALDPATLPSSEPSESNPDHANYIRAYDGGTVKFWGVLTGHQWLIYGKGIVEDPTGKTSDVTRTVSATIQIKPSLTQTLNNNSWNYFFAKNTASACDVTFENSIRVDVSLFILGDLCFYNSASIVKSADPDVTNLYVGEHVWWAGGSSGSIGTSTTKINEAHIVGGCKVGGSSNSAPWVTPCTETQRVYANTIKNTALIGNGPVADFDYWYTNAKPGPKQFCTVSANMSATAFESSGSTTRNNSAATFNLTPATSYVCQYWDTLLTPAEMLGELSWDAVNRVLKVRGVIYIDGSAYVSNNAVNRYEGLGTLYLSGTFSITGSAQLCGGVSGGNCDFTSWDPNVNNLGIIADGRDASGYSVLVQNSARFQGSLYATHTVLLENQTQYDGPMVAGSFKLENNVVAHEFPNIFTVPVGWPGNPNVYAEPQPPQNYSG